MVQICANKIPEGYELTYSFDKDLELYNYRVILPEDGEIESITDSYFRSIRL